MKKTNRSDTECSGEHLVRAVLLVLLMSTFVLASTELSVAFNGNLTGRFVPYAMGVGTLLWVILTIAGWADKFRKRNLALEKNVPIWYPICLTAIAGCSIGGFFTTELVVPAKWLNATVAILIVVACILVAKENWNLTSDSPKEE